MGRPATKYFTVEDRRQAAIRRAGERRRKKVAEGFCRLCTTRKAMEDHSHCDECNARKNAEKAARSKEWVAQGLCAHCGKPGFRSSLCLRHLVLCRQTLRDRNGHEPHIITGRGRAPLEGTEDERSIVGKGPRL